MCRRHAAFAGISRRYRPPQRAQGKAETGVALPQCRVSPRIAARDVVKHDDIACDWLLDGRVACDGLLDQPETLPDMFDDRRQVRNDCAARFIPAARRVGMLPPLVFCTAMVTVPTLRVAALLVGQVSVPYKYGRSNSGPGAPFGRGRVNLWRWRDEGTCPINPIKRFLVVRFSSSTTIPPCAIR